VCRRVKSVTLISGVSPDVGCLIGMSCYKFCVQLRWLMEFTLLISLKH